MQGRENATSTYSRDLRHPGRCGVAQKADKGSLEERAQRASLLQIRCESWTVPVLKPFDNSSTELIVMWKDLVCVMWEKVPVCVPNQSINIFKCPGYPTDKKFSSVNSHRQDLLPTCKAFPKETTTCIWFTQSHKVCNSTTVTECCRRFKCCDLIWLYAGQSKTKCCSSCTQSNNLYNKDDV